MPVTSSITTNSAAVHSDERPARCHGQRQEQRQQHAYGRADIGNETQRQRQQSPQQRIRNAEHPQPDRNRYGVDDVDDQLHEQIAAHPLACILKRLGSAVKVAVADQPDEAVAQILALEQHEDDDDDDQAGRSRAG